MPKIYPVIHHRDWKTTESEALKILATPGVDGIFLISHYGDPEIDWQLITKAKEIKKNFPDHQVGINPLSIRALFRVVDQAADVRLGGTSLDMLWFDRIPEQLHIFATTPPENMAIFTGVAFKHQPQEDHPVAAAETIRQQGFIPTTSGEATGIPPTVEKIRLLSDNGTKPLAVASGMTPENVAAYAPYLSHILVATGIGQDEHHVDEAKLRRFIAAARQPAPSTI